MKRYKLKTAMIIVLSVLLAIGSPAFADAAVISLHQRHAEDNRPFQAVNLFPGDRVTKSYTVRISHSGNVTVHFHADIRPGYEKLAEVLRCRVVLLNFGETLYDGLMRDMPESLDCGVEGEANAESELYYEITAYLDTSVGNEYQNKELIADFRWWVEDQEIEHLDPPPTGDMAEPWLYLAIALVSLAVLLRVGKTRRKGECGNG